ncbi:hypothetical protein CONLIGDRAFT_713825 [Coniochaeta ligniaria NRRL 30616]|uniref:Rad21/Rec8-like protein N-terminal domain-containing protein n=1 Tax=Coniochaeta ligniaria NRRL 30616 TaxID=1408157 RepID=A0A1J7JDK2_9PEZI|nr:hypothetical protein CONLIGDRAFT_713825 [Coniochaeta ligniaria NRRL 30616]
MFYSHEILTSAQYGVATIWLVATVGPRNSTRKITRKAIQGVNIPRACDTIIQPGAPIALRLQSNLLYGVSRVYLQQCTYMLTDVEKVQSHMQTFFRVWGTSSIDPQAGKAKRDQLVIMDDPAFEPNFQLPDFSVDDDGNVLIANFNQNNTQGTSSQMSPHTGDGSSRSRRSPFGGINISASPGGSFHSGLHQLEMPFGRDSMSSQKPRDGGLGNIGGGEEDQLVMDDDWGIRIDDDGNVVLAEEPQLPELPPLRSDPAAPDVQQNAPAPSVLEPDEMIIDMGDNILPEAEAFPQRRSNNMELSESSSVAAAPVRRQRRQVVIRPDRETMISRAQITAWTKEYAARSDEARKTARPTTLGQARNAAYNLTFGFGISHIGQPTPIPGLIHPLAEHFAGAGLQRSILGFVIGGPAEGPRGHRRTSGEAFGSDPENNERRVRPRLDDTPQAGRAAHEQDAQIQDDIDMPIFEPDTELGREAPGSALSEISAPWNRPGSVPGSSAHGSGVKAGGRGRQVSASPLHGRGSGLPAIERFSDDMPVPFGSDGLGPQDYPSSIRGEQEQARTSQVMQAALDQEGRNFLGFVESIAATKGEARDDGRSWVEFDRLFEPQDANKVVVTQAFFHVLTLATRRMIRVEQDDPMEVPFGTIRLGVMAGEEDVFREGVAVA